MLTAEEARRVTNDAINRIKIEKEVNDIILAASRNGRGWCSISYDNLALVDDILIENGYTIRGQYIIWCEDETIPRKEEDYEEDEW